MGALPLRGRERGLAGALTLAVLLIRLLLARGVDFCGTPDACYYLGTATSLATGQGFRARFLFDLQQAHPTLPNTGIEYWRPGVSLMLLLQRPFGAVTLHGSILLTMLVAVLFAGAAWHITVQNFGDRRLALAAYLLCLVGPSCWIGSLSPDSGLFYGTAVAWFLALFTVRRQGLAQDLAALICIGLAYLIRNDAALLLLPLLLVLLRRSQFARRAGTPAPGSSLLYALAMLAGFLLVLAPMHLLYRSVLGTAFPSGTAPVFFFNNLSQFTDYGAPANLTTLLAPGMKHLIVLRLSTLITVVYRIAALSIGYAALIFLPLLALRHPGQSQRRLPEFTGPAVFLLAALLIYGLVLPAIGQFSALRTAEGVLPFITVLVMLGIEQAAATPRVAAWLAAAVIAANLLAGVLDDRREIASLRHDGDHIRAMAAGLATLGAQPASAVVLTGDAVQFSVTTGFPSVTLPGNGEEAIARAAADFRANYVLLDTAADAALVGGLTHRLRPIRKLTLPAEHTLVLQLPTFPAS